MSDSPKGSAAAPDRRRPPAAEPTSDATAADHSRPSGAEMGPNPDLALAARPSSTTFSGFSRAELLRYARHLALPDVGLEGQARLRDARVLCVGAGGLGSPLALYLAAAGVGTLGLVDFDEVDATNLQRQLLHGTRDIGRLKLDSAVDRLRDVNPHVEVVRHDARLTSQNALDILADYDVVADGTDNFPTRYLVNDACVLLGKPNVYGSVFRWEGQVSVFATEGGPCYRCLFREPPPPGLVQDCAEGGVLGVLPGIIGTMQAVEVVKLVLGVGEPLIGRLLLFDALGTVWREVEVRRDPACPVCGDQPTQEGLIDYEVFCGLAPAAEGVAAGAVGSADEAGAVAGPSSAAGDGGGARGEGGGSPPGQEPARAPGGVPEIDAPALAARLTGDEPPLVLDVREAWEWEVGNLSERGALLIPLTDLPDRMGDLDREWPIVAVCRTGTRSAAATRHLLEAGFQDVRNLRGGLVAWASAVDPELPVP